MQTGPLYLAAMAFMSKCLVYQRVIVFQDNSYIGGTARYGNNATTGVPNPGFVNIEFEQAVMNDIVNNGRTAFDLYGTAQQKLDYDAWLISITNNFTEYPNLNPNATSQADIDKWNTFSSKYNGFLTAFNDWPGNPIVVPCYL